MVTIEEVANCRQRPKRTRRFPKKIADSMAPIVSIPDEEPPTEALSKMKLLSEVCLHFLREGEKMRATPRLTLREAVYEATSRIGTTFTTDTVLYAVFEGNFYDFTRCKTPKASISSVLSQDKRYTRVSNSTYTINPEFRMKAELQNPDLQEKRKNEFQEHGIQQRKLRKRSEINSQRKHVSEFEREDKNCRRTNFPVVLPRPIVEFPMYFTHNFHQPHVFPPQPYYGIYAGSCF